MQNPDLAAVARTVDRISVWLFKRIPLGALAILFVYIGLRMADSSGREQWRVEAPKDKPFRTLTASPAGIHALRADGVCQTFDAQTGKQLWETRLCDRLDYDFRLTASNDLLLATSADGLWVLDPVKGVMLFKQEDEGGDPERVAIVGRCLLSANASGSRLSWRSMRDRNATNGQDRATGVDDPALTCVDFAAGRVAWKRSFKGRLITKLAGEGTLCVCANELPQSWEWKPCARHQNTRMHYGQRCPDCVSRWIPASDRKIEAIDTATGLTRWHCRLRGGDVRRMEMRGGRLLILTNQRMYSIAADGREIGRMSWLSSNLTETIVTSDRMLGIGMHGAIHAASVTPPAPVWNHGASGYVRDVVADDRAIYVSTMEKEVRPDQATGNPAPASHTQLTRELWGDGEEEVTGGESTLRVLSALDPADGRETWRKEDLSGRVVPYDDMFLMIAEGYETALLFTDGGTVLRAHLARNGKQIWRSKMPFSLHNITLLPDRIVTILEKRGSGLFGSGNVESSAIASFNRRSLLNRLMRP